MAESDLIEQLIIGCKKKDRKCQKQVYELFFRKMLAVCLRYSNDTDEAKDLLHESFIKVFRGIEKYTIQGSFEGWVRRIVTNTAIDAYRKKSNSKEITGVDYIENLADESEDDNYSWYTDNKLSSKDALEAIQELSPAYRTVFNMYVLEGHTHQEIAEYLNISVGSSKSNLAKAKINLRKKLLKLVDERKTA